MLLEGRVLGEKLHTHCSMAFSGHCTINAFHILYECIWIGESLRGGCRINCYTLIGDVKLQDVETKEVATVEFRSRRESKVEEEVIQV